MFPLRSARFGTLAMPVPKDFMWFYSHKNGWTDRYTPSRPGRGMGCRTMAFHDTIQVQIFGLPNDWTQRRYADVRALEKGLHQCARWLHSNGYVSFYGCYNEEVGFGEREDTPDARRSIPPDAEWRMLRSPAIPRPHGIGWFGKRDKSDEV